MSSAASTVVGVGAWNPSRTMREAEIVTFSVAMSCACAAPIAPGAKAAIKAALLTIVSARCFKVMLAGAQAAVFVVTVIMVPLLVRLLLVVHARTLRSICVPNYQLLIQPTIY